MEKLTDMLHEHLGVNGFAVSGGRALFMEVVDSSTGLYWMSAAGIEQADFDALEVEEPLAKVGCAPPAMDVAAFQSSPGHSGKVRERDICGFQFINVAAVADAQAPTVEGGPMVATVDKSHLIGFEAGRSVVVMTCGGCDYIEVVGESTGDSSLILPEGAVLSRVELTQPWLVHLPTPTRAFFWMGDEMRSFQGPVTLPETD